MFAIGVRGDELIRGVAGLNLVGHLHSGIIEKKNQVTLLSAGLDGGVGAGRKAGDGLLFVVFKIFEIALLEVANVLAFLACYYGIDQDQARFFSDYDAALRRLSGILLR